MAGNAISNDQQTVTAQLGMVDVIARIKSTLGFVQDSLQAARPGFQGTAGAAAEKAAQRWDEEAAALNTRLDQLQAKVGDANDSFINLDEVNSGDIDKLNHAGVPLTNL